MDFLTKYLTKNPNATYAEVVAAAGKKGHEIAPVLYGRAQSLLGIVKTKKKASKKKAAGRGKKKVGRPAGSGRTVRKAGTIGPRRGPGRPRKAVSATDTLDSLVHAMRSVEQERDQYRDALNQIAAVLNDL